MTDNKNDMLDLESRVSKLEEWKIMIDIARAREEVDREYIAKRFDALEKNLNEFKEKFASSIRWAVYLVIGAFITSYLMPFMFSGKLVGVN